MSDERIKMPVPQNSGTSGTPGSDTSKTGYGREVPADGKEKKEEKKPARDEQGG